MKFLALTHQLPSREVSNAEVIDQVRSHSAPHLSSTDLDVLEGMLNDCFDSAGTTVRYHRGPGENPTDLAVAAGRRAISEAGLRPEDIDLVLYVGIGREVLEPASATIYQDLLSLGRATGFDILDACASWVRALQLANVMLRNGTYRHVLVLNAEFVGKDAHRYELKSLDEFAHWHPSVTIGEAATATVLAASETSEEDDFRIEFRTWGEQRDLCFVPLPNFAGYFGKNTRLDAEVRPMQFVSFGLRLMEFGTRKLVEQYWSEDRYSSYDPDIVFGHSASDGMSAYVLKECDIDPSKFQFGHRRFANTISASVPLSMSAALDNNELVDGQKVLLLVASAGVTTAIATFTFRSANNRT